MIEKFRAVQIKENKRNQVLAVDFLIEMVKDGFFLYFLYSENDEIKHVETLRCAHFNKTKKVQGNLA